MLYDVLPPLLLFISFGGIIVVVSRVVLRMRTIQFSEDIQAEVDSRKPIHEESLLRPDKPGLKIVGNRMTHIAGSMKGAFSRMSGSIGGTMGSIKQRRMEKKELKREEVSVSEEVVPEGKKIQMPEVGLQDRISVLAQKGREGLSSLKEEIASRMPDMQKIKESIPKREVAAPEQKSSPVIRLVRHTASEEPVAKKEEAPKKGIMAQMRRRTSEQEGPLERAQDAITAGEFERAEDILVPHIMKNSSDAKAYMLLGKAAIGKESWDEAMEIFQQVIKIDKNLVDAYADLGHAALNAGKFTLAIQSLQHARDMDENNIRIREELLFIARRMDNKVVEKGVLEELQELQQKA